MLSTVFTFSSGKTIPLGLKLKDTLQLQVLKSINKSELWGSKLGVYDFIT